MLKLDARDEADLRWLVNGDYAAAMGFRSGMSVVVDNVGSAPQPKSNTPEDHTLRAAGRYRRLMKRVELLTSLQWLILCEAFVSRSIKFDQDFAHFGRYPGVLFALPEVRGLADGDTELSRFLRSQIQNARYTGAKKQARQSRRAALMTIEKLRDRGEHELFAALQAFGARVQYEGSVAPPKQLFGLREIGRALSCDHKTVDAQLKQRGIVLRPNGAKRLYVSLDALEGAWPEAARALREYSAGNDSRAA